MTRKQLISLAVQPVALLVIYGLVLLAVEHWRVSERLLTGNTGDAAMLTMLAVGFFALRLFVVMLFPGWVVGLALYAWLRSRKTS